MGNLEIRSRDEYQRQSQQFCFFYQKRRMKLKDTDLRLLKGRNWFFSSQLISFTHSLISFSQYDKLYLK